MGCHFGHWPRPAATLRPGLFAGGPAASGTCNNGQPQQHRDPQAAAAPPWQGAWPGALGRMIRPGHKGPGLAGIRPWHGPDRRALRQGAPAPAEGQPRQRQAGLRVRLLAFKPARPRPVAQAHRGHVGHEASASGAH